MNTLPHISFDTMTEHYTRIENGDEIVQADWCYEYDLDFFDAPINPDMRVWSEAVGKPARDVCPAWEYFNRPIHNYCI